MSQSYVDDLETRYQLLLQHSSMQEELLAVSVDCIKLIDPSGRLVYMNEAGCKALKVDPSSGFGQVWLELLAPEVWTLGERALEQVRAGQTARFTGRSQLPGGPVEAWDNMLTPVIADDGALTSILCVSRNVSQELAAREALRESQERFAMATKVGGLGIWDVDLLTTSLYCDDTWHEIMGRDPQDPVRSMDEFIPMIHPDDVVAATEISQTASDLIASGQDYTHTFRIIRPDGEERWVRSAASLVQDLSGQPLRAIGFVVDITDSLRGQRALEQSNAALEQVRILLEQQSLEDSLTGLPNRRALTAELDRVSARARRGEEAAIVMIDLDHFKQYNDRYGHLEGDAVLVTFADCLRTAARRSDFVARYGGEEFVLIVSDVDGAEPVLRRLFELLTTAAIEHADSPHGRVTISCGCAVIDDGTELDSANMLKLADDALYDAKSRGRNQFVIRRA